MNKKSLYIMSLIIFILGLLSGFISIKFSLTIIALLALLIIIFEDPSRLLYIVALYGFIDYLFRNIPAINQFSSFWDELLFALIIFAWLTKLIYSRKLLIRFTLIDIYIIILILVSLFLLLMRSPDLKIAIEGIRVVIEYALWFFVGLNLMKNAKQFNNIISIYIFMIFCISLYGIYQYIIGVEIPSSWIDSSRETYIRTRVFSIIGSPNVLGSLLAMTIPISLSLVFYEENIKKKVYYVIATLSMIITLAFTFSRGAWLAFIVSMLIYGIFKDKRIIYMLFSIIFIIPVVAPSILQRILYMLSPQYAQSSAKGGRILRWTYAFNVFKENILFGVGFGRFGGAVAKRNIPNSFYVDNFYLKSACEMGLIGLIALLSSFIVGIIIATRIVRKARNSYLRNIGMGVIIGLVTLLLHNFVENIFEVPMMTTYFWLFLGFVASIKFIDTNAQDESYGG
ncbi:O-antigen ligase family protein [Caldicellulosiruptoraceae bacterium PP1]